MSTEDQMDAAHEQRYATLGSRTPACACGETNPFALTGAHPGITCYECQAVAGGRSRIEAQHVQGRANGPETVPMLGNDHRVVDAYKITWPEATLRNPDGDPLLRAAGCLRGWLDLLRVVIDRSLGWIPAFLEWLAAKLQEVHGPRWWDGFGYTPSPS